VKSAPLRGVAARAQYGTDTDRWNADAARQTPMRRAERRFGAPFSQS